MKRALVLCLGTALCAAPLALAAASAADKPAAPKAAAKPRATKHKSRFRTPRRRRLRANSKGRNRSAHCQQTF